MIKQELVELLNRTDKLIVKRREINGGFGVGWEDTLFLAEALREIERHLIEQITRKK